MPDNALIFFFVFNSYIMSRIVKYDDALIGRERKNDTKKKTKKNSPFLNWMIRKLVFIFLGVYIILNSAYGIAYHRKNHTNPFTNIPSYDTDGYYDDYDYRISDGYKHELNHILRYSFTLLIILCFK